LTILGEEILWLSACAGSNPVPCIFLSTAAYGSYIKGTFFPFLCRTQTYDTS
jgi:hypothetical protein